MIAAALYGGGIINREDNDQIGEKIVIVWGC
jgi:hypothetical protein